MYLEVDEGFDQHPKTLRLCGVMKDPNAGQYLFRLWTWACRCAEDGDLSGMGPVELEHVMRYQPADGRLFAALTETWSSKYGPWIDVGEKSMRIHGWMDRQGAAIDKMKSKAGKVREWRQNRKRTGTVPVRKENDSATETAPFRTDQTRPDQADVSLSVRVCDPSSTEHVVPRWEPGRPTPYNTVSRFLAIRAEILGIEKGKLFSQPQSGELEKAGAWLASMGEDEVADIEPAIRKACQHAKARSPGWTHESITNSAFLLGAIVSKWRDLREELHGVAPKVAAPPDRPGQQRPVHYPSLMRTKPNNDERTTK